MAKKDEISSTEKLLGLIRGEPILPESANGTADDAMAAEEDSPAVLLPKSVLPFKKRVRAGVVIGHRDITIAVITSFGDRKFRLLDYAKIPIEPNLEKDAPRFGNLLKNSLNRYCRNYQQIEIWSTIPSARVEIRFVQVPKVPDHQVANAIFWTYKKQVPFEEKDIIFDFELLGETTAGGSRKINALAYSAPRLEVENGKNRFARLGFPLSGITIVPFAVQNLFRANVIRPQTENVCTLYIGRDWSRIDIFTSGNLVLSRDIKTGMNSFIEAIRSGMGSLDVTALTSMTEETGSFSDKDAMMTEDIAEQRQARRLFQYLLRTSPQETLTEVHQTVLSMVEPVLNRLARQVERTLDHFILHFDQATVGKFYLAGDIGGKSPLINLLSELFSHPIEYLDPFQVEALDIGAMEKPATIAEKDSFVPAIGTALSDAARTPNLNFTFRHKAIQAKIRRINRVVFAGFFLLAAFCLGVFFWQGHLLDQKKTHVASLENKLAQFGPNVDPEMIRQLAAKIDVEQKALQAQAQNFVGMAVISELVELTGDNIRLVNLKIDLGNGTEPGKAVGKRTILLEGMVIDPVDLGESELAVYMLRLKQSVLFSNATVVQKEPYGYNGAEALRFTAKLEAIP